MAHTKSALKRVKTSGKSRIINKSRRSAIATVEKKLRAAAEANDLATTETFLKEVYAKLDKAVKGGTLHRNAADRKKSRLAAVVNAAKTKKA